MLHLVRLKIQISWITVFLSGTVTSIRNQESRSKQHLSTSYFLLLSFIFSPFLCHLWFFVYRWCLLTFTPVYRFVVKVSQNSSKVVSRLFSKNRSTFGICSSLAFRPFCLFTGFRVFLIFKDVNLKVDQH